MLNLVHFVAVLVQIYSIEYIKEGKVRYFALLQFFIFSMLGIVLSNNLFLTYVFWELVGLSSYLLIGFWYYKPRAVWAAKKAFLLNRVGDIGFLIGIVLCYKVFETTDFSELFFYISTLLSNPNSQLITHNSTPLTLIGLLLFCGTIGKSAQWPLSAWLPDAMEGPTPVSALIHAATMVAAGVYMLMRISFILTPVALLVVVGIGTITLLLGAYRAIFQTDIKRVLAFSTISQLGLMVLAIGLGTNQFSMFHLLTHAFFKAGLFLCAGVLMHEIQHSNTSNLRQKLPITFVVYTICAASLIGLPLTSGFLSKEAILGQSMLWAQQFGMIAYLVPFAVLLGIFLTAIYVTKQWKNLFFLTDTSVYVPTDRISYEKDWRIAVPLVVLALLSLFFWFSINPFNATFGWFYGLFGSDYSQEIHAVPILLSITSIVLGMFVGWKMNTIESPFSDFLALIYDKYLTNFVKLIASKLSIFDQFILDRTVNGMGYLTVIIAHLIHRFDSLIIDGSVNLLAYFSGIVGNQTRAIQNGRIQSYWIATFIGISIIILLLIV